MEMTGRRSFGDRLKGAALLHVDVYEEVEADTSATTEAAGVVALVAVASAVAASSAGVAGILWAVVAAFVGWLIWAGLTYLIGDKLLGGTATWGELLRTLGFAQAPGLLLVLGVIPGFRTLTIAVVSVWTLITGVVALRQALDFGTGRAIATALLGWIALALLRFILPGM
ncbi:MAG TPA: YIP1 family protein [Longimicrobiales bacterium]|nr:YIP1 family protein [Longimicrobiales bacterium]